MLLLVHFSFLIQTSNLLANQSAPPRRHNCCFSAVPPLPGSKPPPSESTVLPAPSGLVTYLPSFKRESQTSLTLISCLCLGHSVTSCCPWSKSREIHPLQKPRPRLAVLTRTSSVTWCPWLGLLLSWAVCTRSPCRWTLIPSRAAIYSTTPI